MDIFEKMKLDASLAKTRISNGCGTSEDIKMVNIYLSMFKTSRNHKGLAKKRRIRKQKA